MAIFFIAYISHMDADKMLKRTTDIIKKYYEHTEKYPVLKYKSPKEHKENINL